MINKITKGLILAGGTGSRLMPITSYQNKHMVPVWKHPMIQYPINTLKSYGIEDILVVSGREHMGSFIEYLGSGKDFGVKFHYEVQDNAGGIAEALGLAEHFIRDGEYFAVILGDNIFGDSPDLSIGDNFDLIDEFDAKVFLKKVNDANRFGVAKFDINRNIEAIIEKPKNTKTGYAVTGLYVYPWSVFDIVKRLKPSGRGELEITDVNQYYAGLKRLYYQILDGYWSDAGTFESLARSTQWAINQQKKDAEQIKD